MRNPQLMTRQTRRRWDRLMLPLAGGATVVAGVLIWLTGQLRYIAVPPAVVAVLCAYRFLTPRDGHPATVVEGNRGLQVMLAWCGLMGAIGFGLLWVDHAINGQSLRDPLDWYHYAVFGVHFGVMAFGGEFISRRFRISEVAAESSDEPSHPSEIAVARFEVDNQSRDPDDG